MSTGMKWIKIDTGIFNNTKIQLIKNMPEGNTLIVIWFQLLALAGREFPNGVFVIHDKLPCSDEMLATIFGENLNTVRLALKTFEEFGMIETCNGCVTVSNWNAYQSVDKYENQKQKTKERVKKFREKQRLLEETPEIKTSKEKCNVTVTLCNALDKNRIDKNRIDKNRKDKEEEDKEEKPHRHRYGEYNNVLLTDKDMEKLKTEFPSDWEQRIERLSSYMASTGKSYKNHLATIRNWARMDKEKVAQKKAEEEKHFAGNDDPEQIKQNEEMHQYFKKMGWE